MVAILIGHEKWKLLIFLVCYCVPWTFNNWQLLLLALGCYEHTHLNYDDIKVYSGWTQSKSPTVMITQISVCETTKGGGGGGVSRRLRQTVRDISQGWFSLSAGHDVEVGQARVWLAQEGVLDRAR